MNFVIIGLVGISLMGFFLLSFYPNLGGKISEDKIRSFNQSPNFKENKFVNQIPTSINTDANSLYTTLRDYLKDSPQRNPDKSLPIVAVDPASLQDTKETKVTWLGHSTILLQIDGKRILLDPVFSQSPSPFPFLGPKRYSETLPIEIEELPSIDVVILSHDHYDHLDYESIMKLKDKVRQFYVPLGIGSHLERWGIEKTRIKEQDWWTEAEFEGLQLVSTPARHFSGRSLFDRDATLWSSWVIIGKSARIYFSGDSGYGPHFAQIGKTYGPFDLTLMECGQYDERWSAIHMMPEETVQAHIDVNGRIMVPIHWAAFTLALHDWTEPIERVISAGQERQILISTPKIGESVVIGSEVYPNSTWWR
ncbi:MBL fold metallo-hydrolase [Pelosinus sp. UFO1]|uniref:MBL fold metallo-hydrolase n=1 Tax=Pelosinus sp. UFO1 TaxID=484770 RepID=UPI0004D1D0C4|nr:MBL fold metallo-hydrolase [Pelosinus sp. UFO1]AIF52948.1 hypothetical protein UFO1_3405 [Pelosinus sp. UFO1]